MRSGRTILAAVVLFGLLAVFPLGGTTFYTELVTKIMIMSIFALSLDLLIGYTGLVSFGHAAFFGTAAYTTGWLVTAHGSWRGDEGGEAEDDSENNSGSNPDFHGSPLSAPERATRL